MTGGKVSIIASASWEFKKGVNHNTGETTNTITAHLNSEGHSYHNIAPGTSCVFLVNGQDRVELTTDLGSTCKDVRPGFMMPAKYEMVMFTDVPNDVMKFITTGSSVEFSIANNGKNLQGYITPKGLKELNAFGHQNL